MNLRALMVRIRSLRHAGEVESELDEELSYHLDRETERLIALGMAPDAARLQARRTFGNLAQLKEQSREARGLPGLLAFLGDLKAGLRLALRQPGFTAVVVLSLALGLGVTTAVFSLTYNILLARLDLPRPKQLAMLVRQGQEGQDNTFSPDEYRALRQAEIGALAAMRSASQIAVAAGSSREYVNMHFVDGDFFPLLRLEPLQGRLLTPADEAQQAAVAVLAQRIAERLFPGGGALGRTIEIRGVPFTVVGITPRSFRGLEFPGQFALAIPLSTIPLLAGMGPREDDRGMPLDPGAGSGDRRTLSIVARLAIGRSAAGEALMTRFERCCTGRTTPERLELVDISRGIVGQKDDFRGVLGTILVIALAGMGLVVAVVCSNIASLLLVRTAARERELAVRLSLGASRGRVVAQLVLETLPLALAGGLLGLMVAWWTTTALAHQIPEFDEYLDLVNFRWGLAVFAFTAGAALLAAVSFALYPALRATGSDWAPALRLDGRASISRRQGRAAAGVVVAQVALTLVLVTTASLFLVTLRNLGRAEGGFASEGVLLLGLDSRGTSYEERGIAPLTERLLEGLRQLPGVRAATISSMVPLFGGNMWAVEIGGPGVSGAEQTWARINAVAPGYLATLGIPLLAGRDLASGDGAGAPVALVSEAFAHRYFGNADPLGRSFGARLEGDSLQEFRIVGVAGNAKYANLRDTPDPLLYLPLLTRDRWTSLSVTIRTEGDPMALVPAARQAVETAVPGLRVRRISEMRIQMGEARSIERLAAELAGFASGMAIVLAMMGLYGVVAHGVVRRTRELGIRRALGAQSGEIIRLVAGELTGIVAIGLTLGLMLSLIAARAIRSQLYGVGAHDPAVMLGSVALLIVAMGLAAAAPTRRAVRVDPRIALIAD